MTNSHQSRGQVATDRLIGMFDRALRTLSGVASSSAVFPEAVRAESLTPEERREVGAMMRVNHVGEICAQSLYLAQALAARSPELRDKFLRAAAEESEHLAWTRMRLRELGDRPSFLNPLWFAGSATIGLAVAATGDRQSLAFLRETELQVVAHLDAHLQRLPAHDQRSRGIIERMRSDEQAHADLAAASGAPTMPAMGVDLMQITARVMTSVARYV